MTESKSLPLRTKMGFGICDLGGNLFFSIINFYLLIFLTDKLGLAAGLAGTAMLIGKIWDAVTDPAVGAISDRTTTRWGRRRPYMFVGAIFSFIFMIIMFVNPHFPSQGSLFVWVALLFCLLNTAYTLVNIPYGALTPELTSVFHEQTSLNSFRMSSAVVGTLLGALLVFPLTGLFANPDVAWPFMGGVMGFIMMSVAFITIFSVRENPNRKPIVHTAIFKSYFQVIRQKVFLKALIPWALHITGVTVIQAAVVYYFTYVYHNKGAFQIALGILLVSALIFIPVWVQISKRIGKKLSYNLGMGLFAFMILLFFLLAPHFGVGFAFIFMGIGGIGLATQYVMPYSIIPDVVQYDHAENGTQREGIYYGLWTFTSKFGAALAAALTGWILAAFGYVADTAQSATSILGIRLLMGPVPVVFFIAGIVVLSFYPINQKYYEKIAEKVRQRDA